MNGIKCSMCEKVHTWKLTVLAQRRALPQRKKHFCEMCLTGFTTADVFLTHAIHCNGVNGRPTRVEMPEKATCIKTEEKVKGKIVKRQFAPSRPKEIQKKDATDKWIEKNQEDCLFCGNSLMREIFSDAVKDHCHITGKFRGAAHDECKNAADQSPNYKDSSRVPQPEGL